MSFRHQAIFWLIILVVLTVLFAHPPGGFSESFYFVCTLLPVAIGTSWFFNEILVPRYLFTGRYGKFSVYFLYGMIVSLWAQMIVIFFAFIVLAELRVDRLDPEIMNIRLLALVVYGIVFLQAFINMYVKFQGASRSMEVLRSEQLKRQRGVLSIRANRKKHQIDFDDILYIESQSDYVRLTLGSREPISTRETISNLEKRLPDNFIRIHRSFIVRKEAIQSYTKEEVSLGEFSLPIGRKYKENFFDRAN
jgi:hypothetical protein